MSTDSTSISTSKDIENKKSWNPIIAVVVALFALFGTQIILSILFSLYTVIRGWNTTQANNWLNNTVSIQFLYVLLTAVSALVIAYLYLKRYKGALKLIGLVKPKWTDPLLGLAGFPVYLILYIVAVNIIHGLFHGLNVNQKQQLGFNNPHGAIPIIITFLSLVILPPIAEEILFRGIIYTSLKKIMKFFWALILTSILFASGHLLEGGSSGPLYIAAIDTFTLSIVLVSLREKTGSLYPSMTLHALKNTVAFVGLFVLHLT